MCVVKSIVLISGLIYKLIEKLRRSTLHDRLNFLTFSGVAPLFFGVDEKWNDG